MGEFYYKDNELYCESVRVRDIVDEFGTPAYIYSANSFRKRFNNIANSFGKFQPLVCYSIKSNSNLSILKLLNQEGAGFDVVSGGEIFRALQSGASGEKIVYAGVGKTSEEIKYALENNILMFNCESTAELENIAKVASEVGKRANVSFRINPDVDARTHAKTTTGKKETKFGITKQQALELIKQYGGSKSIDICGIHLHLGSPIYSTEPYESALAQMVNFIPECRDAGANIQWINIGGGYCISYTGEEVIQPDDYANALEPYLSKLGCKLILEPGRYISGPSGILVTTVVYTKTNDSGKKFLICDSGMNHLIRPTLYDSFHRIWVVSGPPVPEVLREDTDSVAGIELEKVDVVGPICETGDYFALNRFLPVVKQNDYLAIFDAGAYGFSMSSHYNSHPKPCEILVDNDGVKLIRKRETYQDIVGSEIELLV